MAGRDKPFEGGKPLGEDELIRTLAADLRPVRRLRPPSWRAALWLAIVAALALALAAVVPLRPIAVRLTATPDMWLAALGSALTAIAGALAAFQASIPGRSRWWALLPIPPALLWIGASGLGCLRPWVVPAAHMPDLDENLACLRFIVLVSVPLSAVLLLMLRRARPLRPGLVAGLGGLAAAAAAASLLWFLHPIDASASDLAVHAFAVSAVVLATRRFGPRVLADRATVPTRFG